MKLLQTILLALLVIAPSVHAADENSRNFGTMDDFKLVYELDAGGKAGMEMYLQGVIDTWIVVQAKIPGVQLDKVNRCVTWASGETMAHRLLSLDLPDKTDLVVAAWNVLQNCMNEQ